MLSLGHVFFKKGVAPLGTPHLRVFRSYMAFIQQVFRTPVIWLGFAGIGAGIAVWIIALAQTDLSLAYPIASLQYVVVLIAARIFLGEKLDKMKLFGTAMVIGGIVLISVS